MTAAVRQLVFDFNQRPAFERADFLVAPCNAAAVDWVDRWPHWPPHTSGVNLTGPPASGKTHLAAVWRVRSEAAWLDRPLASSAVTSDILGPARNIVIDGFDATWPGAPILHLYNLVMERRGAVLLCSTRPVARLGCTPPDLSSRLATLASVVIERPDDALLAGVMSKLFHDRQMQVDDRVLDYLVRRMERSFAEAAALVALLDESSLAAGRPVTLQLARAALVRRGGEHDH